MRFVGREVGGWRKGRTALVGGWVVGARCGRVEMESGQELETAMGFGE